MTIDSENNMNFRNVCNDVIRNQSQKSFEELLEILHGDNVNYKEIWEYPGMKMFFTQTLVIPSSHLKLEMLDEKEYNMLSILLKILKICSAEKTISEEIIVSKLHSLLYPFITKAKICENFTHDIDIKLLVLDVFGTIYKEGLFPADSEKSFEILPHTLQIMNYENEEIKMTAIKLLFTLIQSSFGFNYAVQTSERFEAIHQSILPSILYAGENKNADLLTSIFILYLKLLKKDNIRKKLRKEMFIEEIQQDCIQKLVDGNLELKNLQKQLFTQILQ